MRKWEPPRLYALIGDPVHHSLSPVLQNAAFAAEELNAVYVPLRTWEELVGPLMRELAERGGGGNVTLPHKQRAATALDAPGEAVRATGACNTFWWDEIEGLCGDNTDVAGFRVAAGHLLDGDLRDCRMLLLGAGGAARAVALAALQSGAARIDIWNRSRDRAMRLVRDLGSPSMLEVLQESRQLRSAEYDLVVNATALGLRPQDPLPLDPTTLKASALMDLVYGREETALVRAAREAGYQAEDGRRMLVEQAAAAFERWFPRRAPRGAMLEAVGLPAA